MERMVKQADGQYTKTFLRPKIARIYSKTRSSIDIHNKKEYAWASPVRHFKSRRHELKPFLYLIQIVAVNSELMADHFNLRQGDLLKHRLCLIEQLFNNPLVRAGSIPSSPRQHQHVLVDNLEWKTHAEEMRSQRVQFPNSSALCCLSRCLMSKPCHQFSSRCLQTPGLSAKKNNCSLVSLQCRFSLSARSAADLISGSKLPKSSENRLI